MGKEQFGRESLGGKVGKIAAAGATLPSKETDRFLTLRSPP
jgi:hypothetical protein